MRCLLLCFALLQRFATFAAFAIFYFCYFCNCCNFCYFCHVQILISKSREKVFGSCICTVFCFVLHFCNLLLLSNFSQFCLLQRLNRPVFLGNLESGVRAEDISKVFESPVLGDDITPVAVERLDLKRGFCFVFLKDVATQEEKERAEAYVSQINGMYVPNILP